LKRSIADAANKLERLARTLLLPLWFR